MDQARADHVALGMKNSEAAIRDFFNHQLGGGRSLILVGHELMVADYDGGLVLSSYTLSDWGRCRETNLTVEYGEVVAHDGFGKPYRYHCFKKPRDISQAKRWLRMLDSYVETRSSVRKLKNLARKYKV